jgi:hypothetical protein
MLTPDPPSVLVIGVPPSNPHQDADRREEVAMGEEISPEVV